MNKINIVDFKEKGLDVYKDYNENQLKHIYEPKLGLFIAETPNVISRAIDAGYEPESFLLEDKFDNERTRKIYEKFPDVPVFITDHDSLKAFTGYNITMGILSAMKRRKMPEIGELCKNKNRIAVLENISNPTNVGAIVRSAAALGMEAVIMTSDCADPLYRRAVRVSVGTIFQIPWTVASPGNMMKELKKAGFKTVSLALEEDSISIDDLRLKKEEKLAVILGSEGYGLKKETIEQSDFTVIIPMSNKVDSLNVAAASAVAFWELSKKDNCNVDL